MSSTPTATAGRATTRIPGNRSSATDSMAWQLRGSCRSMDPEIFFPTGISGPSAARTRTAKRVCHDCPVIAQCLTWALRRGEEWGVWGGLSEYERRRLLGNRRRRNPQGDRISGGHHR